MRVRLTQALKKTLPRAALLCAASALTACTTLGPDYQAPDVDWLGDWQPNLYGQVMTPEAQAEQDLGFWWKLFDDPALNRLVEAVKRENRSLRIAGLRILESRAQLGIAGSTLYPQKQQIAGEAGYSDRWLNGASDPGSQGYYNAGFTLAWELDFWGRFRRGIESADAAFFGSIANQQDAQVLLSAQAVGLYFAYRTGQLRIAIARENVAIQRRSYEITERVFKSGQKGELDLQQARTQYLATLSTIPNLESSLIQTRNAICALLGRPPGDLPELDGDPDRLPAVQPQTIGDIPARLLMRRPDIRSRAMQVAAQSAQIGIAEAEYYPSIALLGSIGWSGSSTGVDGGAISVGPGITWNIFDHGRIANNIRVQDARLQQLIEQYQESVVQAAREIDDAAITVVKTTERQQTVDAAYDAAKRSLELANTLYREGYADFNRVLDAQRALFAQADSRLVNQSNHVNGVVTLYKALGGGWLDASDEPLLPEAVLDAMESRSDWGDLLRAPLPSGPYNPSTATGASQHE